MPGTVVTMSEIRAWFTAALDAVERNNGSDVELPHAYYWTIFARDAFDVSVKPEPTLGDVSDDVADIRQDVEAPVEERAVYAWHILEHLGGVLSSLAKIELSRSGERKNAKGAA
jgi:hypothetical protein